jgi:hypothetical protein
MLTGKLDGAFLLSMRAISRSSCGFSVKKSHVEHHIADQSASKNALRRLVEVSPQPELSAHTGCFSPE